MAARRLIIVLLALMAISTVAAALAPPIEERRAETSTESTAGQAPAETGEAAAGVLLEQRIDAGGPPERIGAVAGDRLALTVTSPTPTNVQIPALGLTGFADRGAPAQFTTALREKARYRVEVDDGTLIATIEVSPAGAAAPGD